MHKRPLFMIKTLCVVSVLQTYNIANCKFGINNLTRLYVSFSYMFNFRANWSVIKCRIRISCYWHKFFLYLNIKASYEHNNKLLDNFKMVITCFKIKYKNKPYVIDWTIFLYFNIWFLGQFTLKLNTTELDDLIRTYNFLCYTA